MLKQHNIAFLHKNDSVKIIFYDTLTYNRKNDTPRHDTAPPAGQVQDMMLVACPAASFKNMPPFMATLRNQRQPKLYNPIGGAVMWWRCNSTCYKPLDHKNDLETII